MCTSISTAHGAKQTHRCGIIPDFMLKKIIDHEAVGATRDVAIRTLEKDSTVRSVRYQAQRDYHSRTFVPVSSLSPAASSSASSSSSSHESVVKIYDANHATRLPGTWVASPEESKDAEISEVYRWALITDQFFRGVFERNSIDDRGMDVVSTVHYDRNYSNAFWDGEQMVFGDGDGKYIDAFTTDSDIYAHEFTHGVSQFDSDLRYQGQAGALNESISDVFGIMVKQYIGGETVDRSNWLIGENVLVGDQYALRSMSRPGTGYKDHPVFGDDPQPGSMDAYDHTLEDNGGVHINSGIPNRAFYLASTKLRDYDSEQYSFSWNGIGRVWYQARLGIGSNPTFSEFATRTVEVAQEIFGRESVVEKACRYAWGDVKVELASKGTSKPEEPVLCHIL